MFPCTEFSSMHVIMLADEL